MPHFPGHRPSRLQGLLDRGQGKGLFGPNLPFGGVPLGGRMNLIGGGGPNPAALAGSRSFTNRIGAPGVAPPTSPRTFRTEGRKVSDIFKDAQVGRYGSRQAEAPGGGLRVGGAPPALSGLEQVASGYPGAQVQQAQQVQGVQGVPQTADLNAVARAAGQRAAGTPDTDVPPPAPDDSIIYGPTGTGPEDILDTSQGFFDRMIGEKGSGKRSDISRALIEAGARMMQGSKEGTFATIGLGLEAGTEAYDEAKGMRAWEEDRAIAADERDEKARREQAAITAILGDETLTDSDRNLLTTMVESGDFAGALDRRDRIVDVAGLTTRMEGIEGLSDTDKSTVTALARYDRVAANQFLEGRVANIDYEGWRQGVFDDNAGLGPDADPVFSSTEIGWLALLPREVGSSFMMDRLADEEMRPSVREGLKQRYFGYDPQAVLTQDQEDMLDGLVEDLEVGTALLGAPNPTMSFAEGADGVHVYRNGIEIEIIPPEVAKDVPTGLIESLPALKDFSEDFYANKVEYLASRRDLNQLLDTATEEDFGRLNTLGYEILALMEKGGSDLEVSAKQAEFLQALNTIGFENLSLFVGPTSDFEAGLAQMIQGNLTLSRDRLKELASRQLRQRLNLWARHNDRVERAAARLPQGSFLREEAESHYIRLMAEDVPGFTLDEWQREMGDRSGAGGGSRILFEGKFPVTGAQTERSEDIPGVRSTAGDYWNLGGGTPGVRGGFDLTVQGTGGQVNQMQYPWSALPRPDLANRQLFTPGLLWSGQGGAAAPPSNDGRTLRWDDYDRAHLGR